MKILVNIIPTLNSWEEIQNVWVNDYHIVVGKQKFTS